VLVESAVAQELWFKHVVGDGHLPDKPKWSFNHIEERMVDTWKRVFGESSDRQIHLVGNNPLTVEEREQLIYMKNTAEKAGEMINSHSIPIC
jgi:glutathionylspermidine synthase